MRYYKISYFFLFSFTSYLKFYVEIWVIGLFDDNMKNYKVQRRKKKIFIISPLMSVKHCLKSSAYNRNSEIDSLSLTVKIKYTIINLIILFITRSN